MVLLSESDCRKVILLDLGKIICSGIFRNFNIAANSSVLSSLHFLSKDFIDFTAVLPFDFG